MVGRVYHLPGPRPPTPTLRFSHQASGLRGACKTSDASSAAQRAPRREAQSWGARDSQRGTRQVRGRRCPQHATSRNAKRTPRERPSQGQITVPSGRKGPRSPPRPGVVSGSLETPRQEVRAGHDAGRWATQQRPRPGQPWGGGVHVREARERLCLSARATWCFSHWSEEEISQRRPPGRVVIRLTAESTPSSGGRWRPSDRMGIISAPGSPQAVLSLTLRCCSS